MQCSNLLSIQRKVVHVSLKWDNNREEPGYDCTIIHPTNPQTPIQTHGTRGKSRIYC